MFDGEVKVDEELFTAEQREGKRGRGAARQSLAVLRACRRRNGKVYTVAVPNTRTPAFLADDT